jgi:hypothetical protein
MSREVLLNVTSSRIELADAMTIQMLAMSRDGLAASSSARQRVPDAEAATPAVATVGCSRAGAAVRTAMMVSRDLWTSGQSYTGIRPVQATNRTACGANRSRRVHADH